MASKTLIFMPNGDVTLTLLRHIFEDTDSPSSTSLVSSNTPALEKKPSTLRQAAIDGERQTNGPSGVEQKAHADPKEPEELEESALFFAPDPPESEYFQPPPPRAGRGSNASSRRDRSASPPASFWASLKRQSVRLTDPLEDGNPVAPPKPAKKPERIIVSTHVVSCVVSSRHMMLASQSFEKMLSGNSNEAKTLRNKGRVTISLSAEADLDAMTILLNIVHGISRKVPRQVSFEELSQLAVLVSSFGMLDAVQFFSDTWIDNLQRQGLPESYNENVLPLVFVFWVFDRPSDFKNMTKLIQRECDEKLDEDIQQIPIPHNIIDAIKSDREFAMQSAITVIHTLINKYIDGQTICAGTVDEDLGYACDAMILGSLMKSSRRIGIWPKPAAPFSGRNFKDLSRAIRSIRILDVCKKSSSRRLHLLSPSFNSHGLEDSIEASMKSIENCMDGLELSEYPRKSDDDDFGLELFVSSPSDEKSNEETREGIDKTFLTYLKEEARKAPEEKPEVPQKESAELQATFPTRTASNKVEEPLREDTKFLPKQFSNQFQNQEPQISGGVSVHERKDSIKREETTNLRDSRSQETETPSSVLARMIGILPNGEARSLADKAPNTAASFPRGPRDEVTSPAKEFHSAPRVVPTDDWDRMTSHFEKRDATPPTAEAKAALSDALNTTEEEEVVAVPQNFKMRKSKKKFAAKY